uniref:CSON015238 protein n=2 Tax=Culicoides sonorensis TaxID=179676 RepID=A0A336MGV2_CULSO
MIMNTESASTTLARTNRDQLSKAYDLFDAELDISKDKRAQKHLGAMACTQVICTCPLMILRLAKMVLTETYENTSHFDLTYLMFVWIAFLPAAINPWIYGSLVLPRPIRDRFFSYFQFGSHNRKQATPDQRSSFEEESSTMLENGGSMLNPTRLVNSIDGPTSLSKYKQINSNHRNTNKKSSLKRPLENKQHSKVRSINEGKTTKTTRLTDNDNYLDTPMSLDTLNNSCSNITASTYCINSCERESIHFETSPYTEKHSSLSVNNNNDGGGSQRSSFKRKQLPQVPPLPLQHLLDKRPSYASTDVSSIRRDSNSTLERDMEIIDILERERSMDLQEINESSSSQLAIPRKASRKMPRSPKQMLSEEMDGYAGDRSTCSGYTVNSMSNARKLLNERMPTYDRILPTIRRTSHDMDDVLSGIDRKISRTKSNEPQPHSSGTVRQQIESQYRRHSSEKYPFYNNYSKNY